MKLKSFLLTTILATASVIGSAHANLLISYNSNSFGLFSDTGSLLTSYSTALVNPQSVALDNSGNVYVAEYGTPGSFNGNVKMYNLATGAFVRNILSAGYSPTGLAFNPANAGEIIVVGQYSGANSQLGRWNTNATGSFVATNSALGAGYTGAFSDGTSIFLGNHAGGGIIQSFDATTTGGGGVVKNLATPNGITGFGGERYYATNNGEIWSQSSGTPLATGLGTLFGITNDGTNLIAANYTGGTVTKYTTSGTAIAGSSFNLTNPAYVAFTPVPEPSTWAFYILVATCFVLLRRRRAV